MEQLFSFVSTTPDGFIFYHEFDPNDDAVDCFYQYSHSSGTYTQLNMPSSLVTRGVEYQNGALLDGRSQLFFNQASTNNIKYVDANGNVQGWSDPSFIAPEYITKGDKGVFFSVEKKNPISGAREYSVQKLVAPNVFSQLNYSEKFYNANGFGGYYETKPRLIVISKDYLYAYQPHKLDTVLMPGGLLRIKLLNENNLPPVAVNDAYQLTDTTYYVLPMRGNDTDPNNDYIYSEILQTGVGTVEHLTNQDIKYRAPLFYTGPDTLVYRACDLGGLCSQPATIVIQVTASGVQPDAVDDQALTYQAIDTVIQVVQNDDVQNQSYVLNIIDSPSKGSAVLQGDSSILYQPSEAFVGLDSLVYTLRRSTYNYIDTAKVYINVQAHPFGPNTQQDDIQLTQASVLIQPLGNDQNPTGGKLTMNIKGGPYRPNAFLFGISTYGFSYYNAEYTQLVLDSVLYEACNASGLCTQEWIYIHGQGTNSIDEIAQGDFELHPNPAQDEVHIRFPAQVTDIQLIIWDATGRELMQVNKEELKAKPTIDLSTMASGLYRIAWMQNGTILKVKNLIKE